MKFLVLLVLAVIAWRMFSGKWLWQSVGVSARSQAEARARSLLGVNRHASRDDIIDAHRRLVTMVHPDRGGTSEQVHEANDARDLLIARLPQLKE